jgi:hypothetical protein
VHNHLPYGQARLAERYARLPHIWLTGGDWENRNRALKKKGRGRLMMVFVYIRWQFWRLGSFTLALAYAMVV